MEENKKQDKPTEGAKPQEKPKEEKKTKEVIQIHLREAGEIEYFFTGGMKLEVGDKVIVEADRGLDNGNVVSNAEAVENTNSLGQQHVRKVIRKANPWDEEQIKKKTKEYRL